MIEVEDLSARIIENLVGFMHSKWGSSMEAGAESASREEPEWRGGCIGSYRVSRGNLPREVDLQSLPRHPYFRTTTFAYPRVESLADGTLSFVLAASESDWRDGVLGLLEPRGDLPAWPAREIPLFLCPGVVFDEAGGRVGRGKGFYDRYLLRAPTAYRIGIAYDFQVMGSTLPLSSQDQRMDAIVTESRVLEIAAARPFR